MNSRQLVIMRLEMLSLTEYVVINPNCISCSTIWSSVSKPQGGIDDDPDITLTFKGGV
ncbi:MAG: hypothetical protein WA220_03165 [Candidatus Nitrosopolaris sp.]